MYFNYKSACGSCGFGSCCGCGYGCIQSTHCGCNGYHGCHDSTFFFCF
uniref:Keratin associated protein 21-3 n=1 Tax=Cebus imitator TaxID=2715852 RepID=A0A2K5RQI6_CEBIM